MNIQMKRYKTLTLLMRGNKIGYDVQADLEKAREYAK
jgi:hypothetical protein